MPDYSWDEMTSADIGEEYYDWVAQEGSYSGDTPSFWENLLGSQFEGMESATFDQFMSEYGGYLPQDFELGPSSLARAGRLADLQEEQFIDEFGRQKNTALQQVGASGFSGSGMQQTVSEDLWSQYAMQQSGLNLQEQQAYQDIYGEQGQSILDQLTLLVEEGAFADQTYEEGEQADPCDCSCYGPNSHPWAGGCSAQGSMEAAPCCGDE
jgi:hypothetical protein